MRERGGREGERKSVSKRAVTCTHEGERKREKVGARESEGRKETDG